ncbi:MAG: transposase [Cyanobacteria bacterium CAN_BIN43]|nr:transposase [Cyanobacteria bacterium CAN_BIN43]
MLVFEFRAYAKSAQFVAIDEAIRATQFIRNKCIRYWMDNPKIGKYELSKQCAILAAEFPFANNLNSMARQAAAERAWAAISRFYDNCKKTVSGLKGFPSFQKDNRSVEYKTTGWKLAEDRKSVTITDKIGIGKLKLKGTRDLNFYQPDQMKRVRLVKRADGYYVQFCISVDREEVISTSKSTIGLDMGLNHFYTDSNGERVENPRFYRKAEKSMKRSQRLVSRKVKGSSNRRKARVKLSRIHLKISRQRKDHAIKLARCVIQSNDLVVYEDLRVKNMARNHCLAKSISDAGWYQFRVWLEYFGKVFGRATVAVNPAYRSQECPLCGVIVNSSLSTRTHVCQCGCVLDRDENAAINILNKGLSTVGHTGRSALDVDNASGERTSIDVGESLCQ